MDRRAFVAGGSTVLTLGLAGCVDDSLDIDMAGDSSGNDAEAAVEAFLQAAAAGDTETQEELIHEESTGFSPTDEELDITINEVESRSVQEVAEQEGHDTAEEDIENITQEIEDEVDEIGATEYAHVYIDVEDEERGSEEGYLFLVEDAGEWQIYADGLGAEPARAEATGEESQEQISSQVQIMSATGLVTEDETIDEIDISVTKPPGADDIDLEAVEYEFSMEGDHSSGTLSADQISAIQADTDDNVITDQTDRYELSFDATAQFGAHLEAGESVQLTLTTEEDATTFEELRVPDSLVDREAVSL